jgi:hypothetical protein
VPDLGVKIGRRRHRLQALGAHGAEGVGGGVRPRRRPHHILLRPASTPPPACGAASTTLRPQRRYYRYLVEVFVRGVGLVRNLVTDPYSVSLTADSKRSYIADLNAALKPAGWDAPHRPAAWRADRHGDLRAARARLLANDFSVPRRTAASTWPSPRPAATACATCSALAEAGLTDVHLLPVFDLATVPEAGCTTPVATGGAPDSEAQQAAVTACAATRLLQLGLRPLHFNAPEGSYASDAADGARRIVEFRQMVQALHAAGLRVGMDVVYNHTSASGQNAQVGARPHRARLLPPAERQRRGRALHLLRQHRHREPDDGKLMIDSAVLWARQYRIDSFRFDLMGHQPRAVMEQLQAAGQQSRRPPHPPDRRGLELRRGGQRRALRAGLAAVAQRQRHRHLQRPRARRVRGGSPATTATALVAQPGLHQRPVLRPQCKGAQDATT